MKHGVLHRRRASARSCRLQLEPLEARLPLGDALLSTLLTSSWLGSNLPLRDPGLAASKNAFNDERPALHRPPHQDSDSGQTLNPSISAAVFSGTAPCFSAQQSEAQAGRAAELVGGAGTVPTEEAVRPPWQDWAPWAMFATGPRRSAGAGLAQTGSVTGGDKGPLTSDGKDDSHHTGSWSPAGSMAEAQAQIPLANLATIQEVGDQVPNADSAAPGGDSEGDPSLDDRDPPAHSRITRIVIDKVQSPTFDGLSFGKTGQYEKIVGHAFGEVDPDKPINSIITDIGLAPKNAAGKVEYETDFYLLKPIDMKKGNRNIFYEVNNRGNKVLNLLNLAPQKNDPTTAADAGDGLLMQEGYSIVWSGWQPDILPGDNRMTMKVPVARGPGGAEITGEVRTEYIVNAPTSTQNLSSGTFTGLTHASYETVSLDTASALLTRRMKENDARVPIPGNEWAFSDSSMVPFPGVPSTTQISLKEKFDPNFIYELTYTAKNPGVFGLGFAATRDVVSFFKHAPHDDFGTPNPLALGPKHTGIHHALIYGASQSGQYIRSFVDLGFNQDAKKRIVFEGAFVQVAAGGMPLNVRFAQPGRAYGQHEDHLFPAYEAPLTYEPEFDPNTGRTAGILDRSLETKTSPKIFQVISSVEYWQGRQSLDQTDAFGERDVDLPDNVRMYLMSSTQHRSLAAPAPGTLPPNGINRWPANPAPRAETLRALWVALDAWVNHNKKPPLSKIPTLNSGTLVPPDPATFGFPDIPATDYVPNFPTEPVDFNGIHNALTLLDFGPEFDARNESGNITLNPPKVVEGKDYATLVPAVDADGNDIAGIRSTMIQAPLGTSTGWSRRRPGFAADEQGGLSGLFIPFARTQAQRLAAGDPRLSLEERYGDHAGYVAEVKAAADSLVGKRLLLPADAARLVKEADDSDVLK